MKKMPTMLMSACTLFVLCLLATAAHAADAVAAVVPAATATTGATILATLLAILGNPSVLAVIASIAAYYVAKLFAGPKWAPYEGLMITAVKYAEKFIPDSTANAGLARLDAALQEFVRIYTAQVGKPPAAGLVAAVQAGLPVVHDNLDAAGTLGSVAVAATA